MLEDIDRLAKQYLTLGVCHKMWHIQANYYEGDIVDLVADFGVIEFSAKKEAIQLLKMFRNRIYRELMDDNDGDKFKVKHRKYINQLHYTFHNEDNILMVDLSLALIHVLSLSNWKK